MFPRYISRLTFSLNKLPVTNGDRDRVQNET